MNLVAPQRILNFINGSFVPPTNNQYISNINPATGVTYSETPNCDVQDINFAVAAAQEAFLSWKKISKEQRFLYLEKLAQAIDENAAALALAETNDNGKPLWLAKDVDIPLAAENIRFYATGLKHFSSESHSMEDVAINYTLRQPLGVVGLISPWNLPLYMVCWKIAPALAAGNTVVIKPSEVTPMSAYLLCQLIQSVGIPAGVINMVHGKGDTCGTPLIKHSQVKAISFTGSTTTGKQVGALAFEHNKKFSLEMGGRNASIVFADCNWKSSMFAAMQAAFANQGQICMSGSRLLIQDDIYEEFRDELVTRVAKLTNGDPLEAGTKQGAIVSKAQYDKVLRCIAAAKDNGGKILIGGNAVTIPGRCENGYFIAPTIIEGLSDEYIAQQEEIFGPVLTLQRFSDVSLAIALANSTNYGLSASIFTENIKVAHQVAAALEVGLVWVNTWLLRDLRTPFGGVKNSGWGREGGWEAFRFYTEPKNVCISLK